MSFSRTFCSLLKRCCLTMIEKRRKLAKKGAASSGLCNLLLAGVAFRNVIRLVISNVQKTMTFECLFILFTILFLLLWLVASNLGLLSLFEFDILHENDVTFEIVLNNAIVRFVIELFLLYSVDLAQM